MNLPDGSRVLVIYIPLLNEGTDCWRPIEAEQVGNDTYRIVASKSKDEEWPFASGDVVRCERHRFVDGSEGLVAINPKTELPPGIS